MKARSVARFKKWQSVFCPLLATFSFMTSWLHHPAKFFVKRPLAQTFRFILIALNYRRIAAHVRTVLMMHYAAHLRWLV